MTEPYRSAQSRRQFLRTGSALVTASIATPFISRQSFGQAHEGVVSFASLGGSTQTLFEKLIIPKFTSQTGIKVQFVTGTPTDFVAKLRTQKAASGIDVCQLAGAATYEAIDTGLVQAIDLSLVPNAANIDPKIPREQKVLPLSNSSTCFIYNKKVYDANKWDPPNSWFDLWDPRLAGHTGMYDLSSAGGVATLLQISKELTGGYDNLDAAFAKFKELRKTIYDFFKSAGAWETAMQQGDLWLAVNSTTRAMQLSKAGQPVGTALPRNGIPSYQVNLGIAEGSARPKAAHLWVNYLLDRDVQKTVIENIGYPPSVTGVAIPEDIQRFFPKPDEIWYPDWRKINDRFSEITNRWIREVER